LGSKGSSHFSGLGETFKEPEKPGDKKEKKKDNEDIDNRLYLGNIPNSMTDAEVRKMCESFGRLK